MAIAKRGASRRDTPRRPHSGASNHAGFLHRHFWLRPQEDATLRRLAQQEGVSVTEWVRQAIRARAGRRVVEAGQYIRRIVPEAEARAAERELTEKAEVLLTLAQRRLKDDPAYAYRLRQEAGDLLDRAAWFTDVVRDYAKLPPSAPPSSAPPPTSSGPARAPDRPRPTGGAPSS